MLLLLIKREKYVYAQYRFSIAHYVQIKKRKM